MLFLLLPVPFLLVILQLLDQSLGLPLLPSLLLVIFNQSVLVGCDNWDFFAMDEFFFPGGREVFSFENFLFVEF